MADPNIRFLLVDPSPAIRRIVRNHLKEMGHANVDEVDGGMPALALLKREPFAVVISALTMPSIDGLTLLRSIRSDPALAKLRVMMLMTEASRDKLSAASQAGVNGCLITPFTPENFRGALNKVLQLPAQ
jgi:two-component system, chemotaxis family, chemotaxis protein CheY